MAADRPNPDELLARVNAEDAQNARGKLKIFFGYAAGVGKTYAMLKSGLHQQADGVDVVAGYVEPHGRVDTEQLAEGLEQLPTLPIEYRGVTLREFNLDAALARRPRLMLVDELAHTNAPGCRHAKRWQDVEELLQAGINVYATLNVQHIESLNDVISQITGVTVRETIPDAVLEKVDELELVDVTPEELIERLREGKVYVPMQAQRAIASFFQPSNLVALRELSLRQAANRLRRDVESARRQRLVEEPWATDDRLLVCVGPSPSTGRLIRTTKRLAAALDSPWLAINVDTGQRGSEASAAQITTHLQLAEKLGAETHTLVGQDVTGTLLDYARQRNVTKIIVGKTQVPWLRRALFGGVVEDVLERSGDIDVYVIRGDDHHDAPPTSKAQTAPRSDPSNGGGLLSVIPVVGVCTAVAGLFALLQLGEANIVMAYLLGVAYAAVRHGRTASIWTAVTSVIVFDLFFVPPYYSFAVSDTGYIVTFLVMLVIGLLISSLTARLQTQVQAAQARELRTHSLFELTRKLSQASGSDFLTSMAGQQLRELFPGEVIVYLRDAAGRLESRFGTDAALLDESSKAVAQWAADHNQAAGKGTDTLQGAAGLFLPLVASQSTVGALGIKPDELQLLTNPESRQLLENCGAQFALAIERDQLAIDAHEARLRAETEELRNSLLSSVSHDLRTPLAAIAGAASSLLEAAQPLTDDTRQELLSTIVDEAGRLARLVDNLLEMTRLESGSLSLHKQWQVLEEIVGSALARLRSQLANHPVRIDIPANLPLVQADGLLLEQVFINLLENAVRYTAAGTPLEIDAHAADRKLVVRVRDRGPGLPAGSESRLFDKFFRGHDRRPDSHRGAGLGLAICRAAIEVHGGRIKASNRPDGGAEFTFWLPLEAQAPSLPAAESLTPVGP